VALIIYADELKYFNFDDCYVTNISIFVLTMLIFRAGVAGATGTLMELPTPPADAANVPIPQPMETTPPVPAGSKGESPSAGPAPSATIPATKEKQQVGGASTSGVNGTYLKLSNFCLNSYQITKFIVV
jgi:hypothetical protein